MPVLKRSVIQTISLVIGVCALLCGCPSEPDQSGAGGEVQGTAASGSAAGSTAAPEKPSTVVYPADQWWGDGSDPHNQGYTASSGPEGATTITSVKTGVHTGRLGLLPDGTVIVGRTRGITALNPDGSTAWELEGVGDKVDFAISLIPSPRIYLRCNSYIREDVMLLGQEPGFYVRQACRLIALSPGGEEIWRTDLEGSMMAQPCIDSTGSVLGLQLVTKVEMHRMGHMESYLEFAELTRVNPDGSVAWHKILPRLEGVGAPPADTCLVLLRDGKVGFTWVDQAFHVFNAESFREWDYNVVSIPDGPPAVSPNTKIILPANDRPTLTQKHLEHMNMEAMNLYGVLHSIKAGGTKHWDLQAGSDIHTQVAIGAEGWIHFGTTVYHDDRAGEWSNGQVIALNEKGQLQYTFVMDDEANDFPLGAPPLVDGDGTLYISDSGGNLYAVDQAGQLKWQTAIDELFNTNPVIANGVLYIGADDGRVHMVSE